MTWKITVIFTRKKYQKRNEGKEDKGINICYYHRADFWTQEVFIQLGQKPITADRVDASIAKPGRSSWSFTFNFIFIFIFLFFLECW